MIQVDDLVKRFGAKEAVRHVSFRVDRGEIAGFLGPNGAGKTTTLRILTGFLPATSGEVKLDGRPVSEESKAVRKLIGYLPENNPLYEDLRVREYLGFRAALKGIPRGARRKRINEVMEACDIVEVRDRIIGACSKGFRQRVGLADALLADPPLLILDEPTVGLDPGQIVHVRELIRELSKDHTVLLSTHILPEVEAICSRVLIIHEGTLLFDGPVEELRRGLSGGAALVCTVAGEPAAAQACLAGVPGVERVELLGESAGAPRFRLALAAGQDPRIELFRALAGKDLPLLELTVHRVSLEEAFLSITTQEPQPEVPQ
jgi:ABC-2 type transport system ATP-binding protein